MVITSVAIIKQSIKLAKVTIEKIMKTKTSIECLFCLFLLFLWKQEIVRACFELMTSAAFGIELDCSTGNAVFCT